MTVSEQIIQVINTLCEKVGIAIDWTGDNVIPYVTLLCDKLITFEIATSIVWSVLFLVLAIVGTIVRKGIFSWSMKRAKEDPYNEDWYYFIGGFCVVAEVGLWIAFTAVTATQAFDIVKCLAFPEMYLFEYISALISSGGQ
jgi:hypothetical protein